MSAWPFNNALWWSQLGGGGGGGPESDPIFTASPAAGILAGDVTNWDTAYGWGDHAAANYASTSAGDPAPTITGTMTTNWDTAYGWGDHATAGYLTSYTETDPVFVASPAGGILAGDITNWDTAYGWGDHATAGYLTSFTEADPVALGQKGNANGIATLDSGGKVPQLQLPAVAITNTFVCADQTCMLGLSAQTGDVCVRTDENTSYILQGTDPSVLGDWQELLSTVTETDPLFTASAASGILAGDIVNWDAAFGWGDHASAGYVETPMVEDLDVGGYKIKSAAGVDIELETANNATGSTGGILLETGNMAHTAGSSGSVLINTGDVNETGTFSGNIEFDIGSGGLAGSRGDFVFGRNEGGRPIYIYGEDSTTDWVAIKGAGTIADYTLTLPNAAPASDGQALVATTGGVMSWQTVLTSFTETDPVFGASPAAGILAGDITNWDAAFGWGDHASENYLKNIEEDTTDPKFGANVSVNGFELVGKDPATATSDGGDIILRAPAGGATSGQGGSVKLYAGDVTSGNNGYIWLEGGQQTGLYNRSRIRLQGQTIAIQSSSGSGSDQPGGNVTIEAGDGNGAGAGAWVNVEGGANIAGGDGGGVNLKVGISGTGTDGYIAIQNATSVGADGAPVLRFYDQDPFTTPQYVGVKAPDSLAGDSTYTLPGVLPAADGYALVSTTAGVMSWAQVPTGPSSGYVTNPMSADLDVNDYAIEGKDNATGAGGHLTFNGGDSQDNSGPGGVVFVRGGAGDGSAPTIPAPPANAIPADIWLVDVQSTPGYVGFAAPTNVSAGSTGDGANTVWTLPEGDGTNGQVMVTDGGGVLSWATVLTDVVQDLSPQLGADLDVNGNAIEDVNPGNTVIFRTAARDGGNAGGFSFFTGATTTSGNAGGFSFTGGVGIGQGGTFVVTGGHGGTQGGFITLRPGRDTTDESQNGMIEFQSPSGGTKAVETRWYSAGASATNYVSLKASDTLAGINPYTLPVAYPSVNGQALTSTTGGAMSWATVLTDVVQDLSPQLGAALDTNGFSITSANAATATSILVQPGNSTGGIGAQVKIQGGLSNTTTGGALNLFGGASDAGVGGTVTARGGTGTVQGGTLLLEGGAANDAGGVVIIRGGKDLTDDSNPGWIQIGHTQTNVAGRMYFMEASANGNDGVAFQAPADLSNTTTIYTLPAAYPGSDGSWLTSTTAGTMAWTNTLKAAVGAEGTPSITFGVDPNTGFYRVGSDEFAATVGGNAAMIWKYDLSVPFLAHTLLDGNFYTEGYKIATKDDAGQQLRLEGGAASGLPSPGLAYLRGGQVNDGATAVKAADARLLGGTMAKTSGTVEGGDAVVEGGAALASANGTGGTAKVKGGNGAGVGGNVLLQPGYDNTDKSNNGNVVIEAQSNGHVPELRFTEDKTNGSNYVGLKAPASLAADNPYTLPNAYPSLNDNNFADGNTLVADESGNMNWSIDTQDSTTLQTTGGAIQDLRTYSIPSGKAIVVEFTIVAFDSTNSEGGAVRHGSVSAQNIAGTSSVIASSVTTDGLTTSGAAVSVDVEDTLDILRIRVTGAATTTIDWKYSAKVMTQ